MIKIPKAGENRDTKWAKIFKACVNQGDNFFVPLSVKTPNTFSPVVGRWNKKLRPWHFVIRTKDINGRPESNETEQGFRVWRDK